jgi:iron complex transport system permease protein
MHSLLPTFTSKITGLLLAVLLLLAAIGSSIVFGVYKTDWNTLIDAYRSFDGSNAHIVIREVRVPRALIAAAVGASLGIAGTLLQALTKNPLADMGILGLNHGASLFVVAAVTFLQVSSLSQYVWFAFAGTAAFGIAVYVLGSAGRGGMSPLKITLAGAALGALASSFTHALLIIHEKTVQEVLFWLSGSVEGRKLELLVDVLPYMAVAWIGAFLLAGPINTLLLGEDVAVGLGQRTALVKVMTGVMVVLLAGSSVAVAGPVLFVGLITPHVARFLVGSDVRWVVLYSGILGSVLLLAADLGARFAAPPNEIPIGVMTAVIGTPFFIYAARKGSYRK